MPSNFVGVFVDANFLGVIVLGAGFGVALNRLSKKSKYYIDENALLYVKDLTLQVLCQ